VSERRTAADPFGERETAGLRARLNVLGGVFTVESTDAAALQLAVDAFGGLPRHRLERKPRRFRLRLVIADDPPARRRGAGPPRPTLAGGDGLLCATVDAGNFAVVHAESSSALVCISPRMLRYPYHARYELIELAAVTLASRAQSLVPLHAACVGARGLGVLLMGSSGAGKSTLALHALAGGMQLLSEDSAFVALDELRVTGTPNYLHVNPSALGFLADGPLLAQVRGSPMIRRRSGARKYEVDLRKLRGTIAAAPLRLAATVFLSRRTAVRQNALERLGRGSLLSRLRREQPYAAGQPNWRDFERRVAALPAYELRRTEHPDDAVRQLQALLAAARSPP
jgi:energy-coupling factor transporter ATP-binding protein EcfA2